MSRSKKLEFLNAIVCKSKHLKFNVDKRKHSDFIKLRFTCLRKKLITDKVGTYKKPDLEIGIDIKRKLLKKLMSSLIEMNFTFWSYKRKVRQNIRKSLRCEKVIKLQNLREIERAFDLQTALQPSVSCR